MTKSPTLIDDLDFNNLDKYSSRSLVAWIKRDTGTQAQRELVKRTIEIHGKNTVTGGLVLLPSKKTLETCWYGAKSKSRKKEKMSLEKMKQKL